MEIIEDSQDHFTVKFDWKYDLNVIMAILTSAGTTHKSADPRNNKLITERANVLRKEVFPSSKFIARRKNHA